MTNITTRKDSFDYADHRIKLLLAELEGERLCACCVARALMYRGSYMTALAVGSVEAANVCEEMATGLRKKDMPPPEHGVRH